MSCSWPLLVTAHQQRLFNIWNLALCFQSSNFNPQEVIESPLKYATSALQCFADGKGFCIGSIEGRTSVKSYDFDKADKGDSVSFCFKCHRKEGTDKTKAEVNAIHGFAFNKQYNTFFTYGGDGHYVTWNKDSKARYRSSAQFPAPIVAGDQTEDGKLMAYAIGYDWAQGASGLQAR